jgi:GNAT superfamily N-acetyltransferase
MEGAGFGLTSNVSSTNPVGAYAVGAGFGTGPEGKYAADEGALTLTSFTDRGPDEDEDPMLRYDIHRDGKNIAYSSLRPESSEGDGPWISGIYVDPEARGEGLAKMLMEKIESDHEGQTLRLRARPYKDKSVDTETLMKIYESMGFESYDEEEPSRMAKVLAEKTAAFGPVRRALFGGGREAFDKIKGTKMIGRWGGMDPEAFEAKKIWDWIPEATRDRLTASGRGFFEDDVLTRAGGQRYRAIDDLLPMVKKRTDALDEGEFERLRRVGLEDLTDEDIAAIEAARGGAGSRIGRGAREIAFGEAPLKMLKQRYQVGGLLGPGGVVMGDMGISPATTRAVKDVLDPKELGTTERLKAVGRAGFYGGQELLDKGLSYGLPSYAVYEMATRPEETKGQRGAALGQTLGDVIGWSAGSPFGLIGGTGIAGTITELGKRIGHAADPPSKLPAGRLARPWQNQAQATYADALRQHRYSQYANMARDAGGHAIDFGQGVFRPGIVARPQVPRMVRSAPRVTQQPAQGTGPMPQVQRSYPY